jgi:hypothetical protein
MNYPNIRIDFHDSYRLSFSGEWEEDVKVRGLIICRDGETYEGQLIDERYHGKGVHKSVNGAVY